MYDDKLALPALSQTSGHMGLEAVASHIDDLDTVCHISSFSGRDYSNSSLWAVHGAADFMQLANWDPCFVVSLYHGMVHNTIAVFTCPETTSVLIIVWHATRLKRRVAL